MSSFAAEPRSHSRQFQVRAIIKEVATSTATWRETAKAVGARSAEINRMASVFEHDDLQRALAL